MSEEMEQLQADCQQTLARWLSAPAGPMKQTAWNDYSASRDKLSEYQGGTTEVEESNE